MREGKQEVHDTDGDMWHGMTHDGTMVPLQEEVILNQFGEKFVDQYTKCLRKEWHQLIKMDVWSKQKWIHGK